MRPFIWNAEIRIVTFTFDEYDSIKCGIYLWSGKSQEKQSSLSMFVSLALLGKKSARSVARIQCLMFPNTSRYSSGLSFANMLWFSLIKKNYIIRQKIGLSQGKYRMYKYLYQVHYLLKYGNGHIEMMMFHGWGRVDCGQGWTHIDHKFIVESSMVQIVTYCPNKHRQTLQIVYKLNLIDPCFEFRFNKIC